MEKKYFIVHIGAAKAGSTAIQEFLALNRQKLLAAGIHLYVPGDYNDVCKALLTPYHIHQHPVETELFQNPTLYPLIYHNLNAHDVLTKWQKSLLIHKDKHILISSEAFFHGHPKRNLKSAEMLRIIFDPFKNSHKLYIVAYLRRQDESLHSIYQQWSRNDCFRVPFSKFKSIYPPFAENSFLGHTLDYSRLIMPYKDSLKDLEPIYHLKSFDQAKIEKDGLLGDFKSKTIIKELQLQRPEGAQNVGVNRWLAIMLMLGSDFPQHDRVLWYQMLANSPRAKAQSEKFSFLTAAERLAVQNHYFQSNKELFGFNDTMMKKFFGETKRIDLNEKVNYEDISKALAANLIRINKQLQSKMRKNLNGYSFPPFITNPPRA